MAREATVLTHAWIDRAPLPPSVEEAAAGSNKAGQSRRARVREGPSASFQPVYRRSPRTKPTVSDEIAWATFPPPKITWGREVESALLKFAKKGCLASSASVGGGRRGEGETPIAGSIELVIRSRSQPNVTGTAIVVEEEEEEDENDEAPAALRLGASATRRH